MAQLNIRLDDRTRDQFDALARARGLTTSDLARELIGRALGHGETDGPRGDITPPSLSALDRRGLAMQHEILAILTVQPDEPDGGPDTQYHQRMVEALNSGYTAQYHQTFQMIEPELTERECSLVHDILEMCTQVERGVGQLGDSDLTLLGEDADFALRFRGFDFNDTQEGRFASYARFLIDEGRYQSLAGYFDAHHEHGNSHAPTLASYQRMLSVWKPLWERKIQARRGANSLRLTLDELRDVLAAWPYPTG